MFLQLFVLSLCVFVEILGNPSDICPKIQSRSVWGAKHRREIQVLQTPVEFAIIAHTVTKACNSLEECSSQIRRIQDLHMDTMKFGDIGYNFLIGGDGEIYEGVGFLWAGTHTTGYNSKSISVAFIGDYTDMEPSSDQLNAMSQLLNCARGLNILRDRYKLIGQRQVRATLSPGDKLFEEICKRPHWFSTTKV